MRSLSLGARHVHPGWVLAILTAACATPGSLNHQNEGAAGVILESAAELEGMVVAMVDEVNAERKDIEQVAGEYAERVKHDIETLQAAYNTHIDYLEEYYRTDIVGTIYTKLDDEAIRSGEKPFPPIVIDPRAFQTPTLESTQAGAFQVQVSSRDLGPLADTLTRVKRAAADVQANAKLIDAHPLIQLDQDLPLVGGGVYDRSDYSPARSDYLRRQAQVEVQQFQALKGLALKAVERVAPGFAPTSPKPRPAETLAGMDIAPKEDTILGLVATDNASFGTLGATLAGILGTMVARRKSKIMRGIVRSVEMGRNALNEELAALPSEQRRKVEAAFKAAIVADQAKANIGHDVEKLLQSVRGEMQRNRPAPPASPAA